MRGSTVKAPDEIQGRNKAYYNLLSVLDTLFAALIVAPAVVAYWRGVWELMDVYVFPENALWSALISTGIGICGHMLFALSQEMFAKCFHPDKNRISFYVVSRIYTVCFAFVCVNGWRGPWMLLHLYTKSELMTIIATILVGTVALAAMRALRNVSAPPFTVIMDSVQGYFEVLTMFRVSMGEKTSLYILDCLFSVIIVGTLVVFVWRGGWVLMDIFIFPENEVHSAWGSLLVGYAIVAVAFLMQPAMRMLCDRLKGALRLFAADVFLIFSLVGTINVWRGIWNLLNIYLLPDNLALSCWLTHWTCWILLVLLGCSNSLLVRGVYIDAEEPAGKCVVFPCYYLRIIFQEERIKKLNTIQLEATAKRKQDNTKPTSEILENNHIVNINTISDRIQTDINHKPAV